MEGAKSDKKHFVLVHGAGTGAWSWYKVKPCLEAEGHRVTALDMEASGVHTKCVEDVNSFYEYSKPLLNFTGSLKDDEKVLLVGHSLGGMNLALAMEEFPEKISVAVFGTAILPDTIHNPYYASEKLEEIFPKEAGMDNEFSSYQNTEGTSVRCAKFGPKYIACKLYQLSPIEDVELARTLHRPVSVFRGDLADNFTDDKFGSVKRVYVVCDEDQTLSEEFQRWMIGNCGVNCVMEIKGAAHMPMASKPKELLECLLLVAEKFA